YKETAQSPYKGENHKIPGKIEAEHYDLGGEGFAYHDDESKEGDINFRPDDYVDVVAKSSASNDSVVSFINEEEWLEYTVDADAGRYDITLFYFSGETGGDVVISLDGEILDTINGFGNQGLEVLDSITVKNILLPEGGKDKILRLEFINDPAFDIDAIKFTRLFTPVTGISLNSCPSDTLLAGDTHQLTANAEPYYADNSTLRWESSDEAVASVDSTGKVMAISDGIASITVTTNEGGYSEICNIVVQIEIISVYGVTIGDCPWSILQTGDIHQLIANVAPGDATDRSVTWKSTNPEVASVDENGLVSAISQGSVKITITTNDGGYTSTCNIGVMSSTTGVESFGLNDGIKIYPNPASDKLNIARHTESPANIKIFNLNGQLVHQMQSSDFITKVNIKDFGLKGMVMVQVISDQQVFMQKVMVR
ncbi:MAG: Ig-like domain-containing protein, partial [Draconibacterium sp.]|nr:Ig-like domain-containing protein [Draconibacterium sp.]